MSRRRIQDGQHVVAGRIDMHEIVAERLICEWPIYYGNALVSVAENAEQRDRTAECPEREVTVIDSDELISLCGSCGNHVSADFLRELISSAVVGVAGPR